MTIETLGVITITASIFGSLGFFIGLIVNAPDETMLWPDTKD